MNNIHAKAKIKETRIVYTYEYDGNTYEIETPRTALNAGVEDGEIVHIMIAVMPIDSKINTERMLDG